MRVPWQAIISRARGLFPHLPYWYPCYLCYGVAFKVANVDGDGGELENDDNAVRGSRQSWSLCDK
jgi:hypothetical protein